MRSSEGETSLKGVCLNGATALWTSHVLWIASDCSDLERGALRTQTLEQGSMSMLIRLSILVVTLLSLVLSGCTNPGGEVRPSGKPGEQASEKSDPDK